MISYFHAPLKQLLLKSIMISILLNLIVFILLELSAPSTPEQFLKHSSLGFYHAILCFFMSIYLIIYFTYHVCVCQSLRHVQLFVNPWNVANEGSSVYGILQARILEWVAIYHAIYFTSIYLPYHALIFTLKAFDLFNKH